MPTQRTYDDLLNAVQVAMDSALATHWKPQFL